MELYSKYEVFIAEEISLPLFLDRMLVYLLQAVCSHCSEPILYCRVVQIGLILIFFMILNSYFACTLLFILLQYCDARVAAWPNAVIQWPNISSEIPHAYGE